jgi:hypothetical protein
MEISTCNLAPAAFRCPICSSAEHQQVQTSGARGTSASAVYRCFNCHVYFLAPPDHGGISGLEAIRGAT